MKNSITIKLIDGIFDQLTAKEIILTMINKKIEFLELNSFSDLVKYNQKDEQLEARIEELKKERLNYLQFIQKNKENQFKIASEINIEVQ